MTYFPLLLRRDTFDLPTFHSYHTMMLMTCLLQSPYNIVRYEAVGLTSQSYFAINSVTGVVTAQRSLTLDQSAITQYTVSPA